MDLFHLTFPLCKQGVSCYLWQWGLKNVWPRGHQDNLTVFWRPTVWMESHVSWPGSKLSDRFGPGCSEDFFFVEQTMKMTHLGASCTLHHDLRSTSGWLPIMQFPSISEIHENCFSHLLYLPSSPSQWEMVWCWCFTFRQLGLSDDFCVYSLALYLFLSVSHLEI